MCFFKSRQRKLDEQLLQAINLGETDRVRQLLDQGADVNANDGYDCALSRAGRAPGSNAQIVQLLLERGADINGAPPGRGVNPLLRASHLSDDEIIRLLVMHGAPLNIVQEGTPGFTPLQELVRWAAPDTITLLLDRGAEVNMRSLGKEWTALHVAAVSDRPEIVQLLLLRGGCDSWVR